jgi:2-phospho-L-lactate/phosphoenolpyruvate guanylyltransferase
MKVTAIVPHKALARAKSRLDPAVGAPFRLSLTVRWLRHVCATLRAVPDVESFLVMSPDPALRAEVSSWGVRAIPDPQPELNAALAQIVANERMRALLIVAADLPCLEPAEIQALIRSGSPRVLALAPSKEGTGTNALLIPRGVLFRPAYGGGSRAAHWGEARRRGLEVVEVVRPGLAFDVDTPADVAALSPSS